MIFFELLSNPMFVLMWVAGILFAMTIHEFAHAAAATALGDTTPEAQGRLTFNPFAHIDTLGLFMLMLVGFGWGKPVIFDHRQLRNPRLGSALVGLAGPFANLLSIVVFGSVVRFFLQSGTPADNYMIQFFIFLVLLNTTLMVFNLIPIPPLDGSHVLLALLPDRYWSIKQLLVTRGPTLLFGLVILDMMSNGQLLGPLFHRFQFLVFQALGV